MATRIWSEWLPPDIAAEAASEEPARFGQLVDRLVAEVAAAASSDDPNRFHRLLRWIPLLNK